MRNWVARLALLVGLVGGTLAGIGAAQAQVGSPMPVKGSATQPVGHYDFCRVYAERCKATGQKRAVKMTNAVWDLLNRVNLSANIAIVPRTDLEMHGVSELWSYPRTQGDCEDFVLYKQRELEKAGLPASALLITVVAQTDGSGHAVLTVVTDQGDLVLDNLDDRILPWEVTEYTYLKRQAQTNAGRWVSIQDSRELLVGSVR